MRSTPLAWMLAEDEHGTDLAVFAPRRQTLLYPMKLVGERWMAEATGEFITTMADEVSSRYGRRRRRPRREAR